ncbi:hypothetical protein SAMN05216368_105265 [Cryobacterium flavum]|uniref:Uncharacterized protein n=1 Tax=Cryobacterium flavum TaxID=1424659 RepID=A0A4R8UZC2_9MICO|nr:MULTISPECIES: hypothetical protein [Cryobacterium]TFB73827.1 hypothetical protein E3O21_16330 [Cryobacterium flavum]SDN45065.1 hypothetical protein SAMN05216368_105265 [Cryobacterium flavum]
MTTPLSPTSPNADHTGANTPTEDFSATPLVGGESGADYSAESGTATTGATLSDNPTIPYPESSRAPRENDFFAPNTDLPTAATATPRLRPRFGTILWGILLLAFATYMVVFTLLPAPPDPTLWLLGGVIAVGLGLVVAGIAAAARRAD